MHTEIKDNQMDLSSKGLETFVLMPYIVLPTILLGFSSLLVTFSAVLVSYLLASFVYRSFVANADERSQIKRFVLFFTLPIIVLFGMMYV